jgi:hypothetical protein
MASVTEIQQFLNDFHVKMGIWNIVFRDDRGKNMQTLFDLEITQAERRKVVEGLKVTDYCEGPIEDTLRDLADMWVFGKQVKGKEIYIKITMGFCGAQVVCISFHIAEHPMNYPHRNKE